MGDREKLAFLARVLGVVDRADQRDDLFWRTGEMYGGGQFDYPASFMAVVNDVFWWGTADLEPITPESVDDLENAYADCKKVSPEVGECFGAALFAARKRKMRPQGAWYPNDCPEVWPLFDACGPEREIGFCNPKAQPKKVPS